MTDDDFENEKKKKMTKEQKQRKMEEKKQKKPRELKWITKTEIEKEDEQELWSRFKELNNKFEKMKEQKKLNNKKKKLYLYLKY